MGILRGSILAGCAATLFIGAAQAADLAAPPPEAFDWSGFYLGATAGYVWGEADFDTKATGAWVSFPAEAAVYENETDMDPDPQGFVGGLKLGWNGEANSFVFGLEGDFSYADAKDSEDTGPVPGTTFAQGRNKAELSWLGTLRLRAGIALDAALIYATGGVALGKWDVKSDIGYSDGAPVVFAQFDDDDWKFGWVIGGGIEYALSQSWSLNAEYLYMDFGNIDGDSVLPPPAPGNLTFDQKADLTAQIVRAGLSFHFQ